MDDAVVQLLHQLVQAGAVPGKDFSCDPERQALHLHERCVDLLQAAYPEVDWTTFLAPFLDVQRELIGAIHDQLGCSFVEALTARIVVRCQGLGDAQAAWYLQQIVFGVEDKLGLRLLPVLDPLLLPEERCRMQWLLRQDQVEPCGHWLYDLVIAAGGSDQDVTLVGQEVWLSEDGLRRLQMVWADNRDVTLALSAHP